jgi:cell division septation protein DedD
MPKKTANARSGVQRGRTRQKSFELVRPNADENVLETMESSEDVEIAASEAEEMEMVEVKSEPEKVPVAALASTAAVSTESAPKSAASRMAARRQAALKAQRTPVSLIAAENYGYVRKDLIFILILAIIMFAAIIIMHFVPAIGG